jgi:hypothetical protein
LIFLPPPTLLRTTAESPEPYTTAPGGTGVNSPAPSPPPSSLWHTNRSVWWVREEATWTCRCTTAMGEHDWRVCHLVSRCLAGHS